jgi:hypothetical protein
MSILLASDDQNPEFVNPKNPDDALHVEFFDYAALDDWETQKMGTKIYKKECPFVRMQIPGNNLNIIERPADGRDVNRFPRQWMYYQMQTGKIADGSSVPGWQIDEWNGIELETKRKLKFLRFATVEQLAGATDSQIQAIGMGADGLRIQARKALRERNRRDVDSAVAERDVKIKEQGEQITAMQAQMAEMMELMRQPQRGKPGRKPKEVAA